MNWVSKTSPMPWGVPMSRKGEGYIAGPAHMKSSSENDVKPPAQLLVMIEYLHEHLSCLWNGVGYVLWCEDRTEEREEYLGGLQSHIHDLVTHLKNACIRERLPSEALLRFIAAWIGLFRRHPDPIDAVLQFPNEFKEHELKDLIVATDPLKVLMTDQVAKVGNAKPKLSRDAQKKERRYKAMVFVLQHQRNLPSLEEVAAHVGCNATTLHRDGEFKRFWKCSSSPNVKSLPRGTKYSSKVDAIDVESSDDE